MRAFQILPAQDRDVVPVRGRFLLRAAQDLLGQAPELQLLQQLGRAFAIQRRDLQGVDSKIQGHVRIDGDQLDAQPREVRVVLQPLPLLSRLQLIQPSEQGLDVAELLHQRLGRFLPDPRHARHVVHAVPHEAQHVHDVIGRDAEPFFHLRNSDPPVLHGVPQANVRSDELIEVLVGRDDRDVESFGLGLPGERPDEVVGLDPLILDDRDAEGLGHVPAVGPLDLDFFGRFGPVGLVRGIQLQPLGRRSQVEGHGAVRRSLILQDLPEHLGVSVDGVCRHALGVGQARPDGVIGPEDVARAVDQVEMWAFMLRLFGHGE